jgi:cytochrome c oxidase subunit III
MSALVMPVRDTTDATAGRPRERGRARWGMALFIATEAMLFGLLFFAYFYLGSSQPRWPPEDPPLFYALILLGVLIMSSVTVDWGQRGLERGNLSRLHWGLGATIVLAVAFLVIQFFEYRAHLKVLTPFDSAYGSLFYTITTFHLTHVVVGLLMLCFAFALGLAGHFDRTRTATVKNVTYYWHFVDIVWVLVVSILYVAPHLYGAS